MSIKITIPNTSSDVLTFGSSNTPTAAQIAGIDSGSSNGQLAFYTTASGTSTERVRVDSSGNVGIGTASPTAFGSGYTSVTLSGANAGIFQSKNTLGDARLYANTSGEAVVGSWTNTALRFYTNSTNVASIDSSGRLLIGTTSTSVTSGGVTISPIQGGAGSSGIVVGHATGVASGEYYSAFAFNGSVIGSITQSGTTAVLYNTTSDYRLKENVQPLSGALARVASLKPCTYTWKSAPEETGEGFIAHELAGVCPQAVSGEKDAVNEDGSIKPQGIDTSFLVATLTAAIQEQQAIITSLTDRITALENK